MESLREITQKQFNPTIFTPTVEDRTYLIKNGLNGKAYFQRKASVHLDSTAIDILERLCEKRQFEGHTYSYIVSKLILEAAKKYRIKITKEEELAMRRAKYTKRMV